ncbi:polyprenyl synthetase family protein [Risungbinella massiliensis]|uniref:polyprenyl synthetase family protein n=1 Tax=Risungbinella massiliensis TaxID=1329796 RepID=UPI0005CBA31B|nr:polyprenyl synthetase family protein [Risungbinella massiliensis]
MKIAEAFQEWSPVLYTRYQELISRWNTDIDPNIFGHYQSYAWGDQHLPRPLLTWIGYLSTSTQATRSELDSLGDTVFLSQLLRDLLAIHDDIVDEDRIKFGSPTLPVRLSARTQEIKNWRDQSLNKQGKDLSLFFGDSLFSFILQVIMDSNHPETTKWKLLKLVEETNRLTQRGQIQELLLAEIPFTEIRMNHLLEVYRWKAGTYCYAFPFEIGCLVNGSIPIETQKKASTLLTQIGAASQIIDDIAGCFPEVLEQGKDTLGELLHLRRTVLLVDLAHQPHLSRRVQEILKKSECSIQEAWILKKEMKKMGTLQRAVSLSKSLINNAEQQISNFGFSPISTEYLTDLVYKRVTKNIERVIKGSEQIEKVQLSTSEGDA